MQLNSSLLPLALLFFTTVLAIPAPVMHDGDTKGLNLPNDDPTKVHTMGGPGSKNNKDKPVGEWFKKNGICKGTMKNCGVKKYKKKGGDDKKEGGDDKKEGGDDKKKGGDDKKKGADGKKKGADGKKKGLDGKKKGLDGEEKDPNRKKGRKGRNGDKKNKDNNNNVPDAGADKKPNPDGTTPENGPGPEQTELEEGSNGMPKTDSTNPENSPDKKSPTPPDQESPTLPDQESPTLPDQEPPTEPKEKRDDKTTNPGAPEHDSEDDEDLDDEDE